MSIKVLYLEDNLTSRREIHKFNEDYQESGNHQIDFVNTLTGFDEELYELDGYKTYAVVVVDLSINMPFLTREQIIERIPLLNVKGVPTTCAESIPLYGLDYYKLVVAQRVETKQMVEQGRVILFSGHAAKVVSRGLYDKQQEIFKHTELIDRAERDATKKLFSRFSEIEMKLKQHGGYTG